MEDGKRGSCHITRPQHCCEHVMLEEMWTSFTDHTPMYLKGFPSFVSWLRHCSTMLDVHWFTLLFWYATVPSTLSTDWRGSERRVHERTPACLRIC